MRIVNFGQVMSLEHGLQMLYQLTVELPTGQRLQVQTDEGTVQQLIDALTNNSDDAAFPPPQQRTLGEMLEEDAELAGVGDVFGEDLDPGELAADDTEAIMGALSEDVVMESAIPAGGLGQPIERPPVDSDGFYMPARAKTVPKDEMGYPIVQSSSSPTLVPDDDGEEDGTQI